MMSKEKILVDIGPGGGVFVGQDRERSMILSVPLDAKKLKTHVYHNWFVDGFVFATWGSTGEAIYWLRTS